MDPISSGSGTNPINNPRVDLLHNTGGNQQLGGAAGAYGPSPMSSSIPGAAPMPGAPTGGGPSSASSYVSSAQGARPAAMSGASVPPPAPRPAATAPLYASSVPSGGGDGGGIGLGLIIGAVVVILLLLGGTYALFSSQLNNQNKQLQAAIADVKNNGSQSGDIKSNTIDNADKITTKTLEVTESEDGVDALTVNGASNLQGPVKTGGDLSVGGNLNVTGDATVSGTLNAGKFVGDGSGLTGVGGGGAAGGTGPAGPRGATGPAGAPNPHATYADNAGNANTIGGIGAGGFVQLQSTQTSPVQQTGSLGVTGAVSAGGGLVVGSPYNQAGANSSYISQDPNTQDLGILNNGSGDIIFTVSGSGNEVSVSGADGSLNIDGAAKVGGRLEVGAGAVAGYDLSVGTDGINSAGAVNGASLNTGSGSITGGAISGSYIGSSGDIASGGSIYADSNLNIGGTGVPNSYRFSVQGSTGHAYVGMTPPANGDPLYNYAYALATPNIAASQYNYFDPGTHATSVGQSVVNGHCGNTQIYTNMSFAGGILTGGTCQSVSNRGDFGQGNPIVDCASNEHIHINNIINGLVTSSSCVANAGGYDYAERYNSAQSLPAGTVVAVDPTDPDSVIQTSYANQASAIGVVSTLPGQIIGATGNTVVALSGRVPVKVDGEAVVPGDYLTTSNTPGYARKAMAGEKTIGIAMSSFDGGSGTVTIFINVSNGGITQSDVQTPVPTQEQGQATNEFADLNASGTATINDLKVTGTATIATLNVTGLATVQNIQVNGHIVGNTNTRGSLIIPAGGTTATAPLTGFTAVPVAVASPVTDSVPYKVTTTTSGVTVTIETPAAADIKFNYLVQQ